MSSYLNSHRRNSHSRPRRCRLESLEARELLAFDITPFEQLMLELVNRARADPVAEIARTDVEDLNDEVNSTQTISEEPKQPLAINQALIDAMRVHTVDMLRRDFFGHTDPDGVGPSDRARDAGYPVGAGENIAWSGRTGSIDQLEEVYKAHTGLVESVGHRINMMRENWREIGPGVSFGTFTQQFPSPTNFNSIMTGTLFGNRGGDNFITGVAISDHVVRNDFYEVGEGIGDVTITATREGTSETYTDTTGDTGGYALQVPNGTYTVTATGGNLSRTITVRAVQVDGKNVKIDFNNAFMPTLYIDGQFFEDANGNGSRDANERGIADRTAWLDLNENEQLDANEPRTVSGSDGSYRIDGLLPGDYTVRQVLPNRWTQTTPANNGIYVIPLDERNLIGVDFGSQSQNESPIARNDVASVVAGTNVVISVTPNDSDTEGNLVASSIQVASPPANGSVSLNDASLFVYVPNAGFSGNDQFTYTVADTEGSRSAPATVNIQVTPAVAWHNFAEPLDVNHDGVIAAQDVLIIIREINRNGPQELLGMTPGEYAWDVSGDDYLSAIDALRIIIYLNQQVAGGEPPEVVPTTHAERDMVFALAYSQQSDITEDDDSEDEVALWPTR